MHKCQGAKDGQDLVPNPAKAHGRIDKLVHGNQSDVRKLGLGISISAIATGLPMMILGREVMFAYRQVFRIAQLHKIICLIGEISPYIPKSKLTNRLRTRKVNQ